MSKHLTPAITSLFAGAEPARATVNFSWRLVCRRSRPFLLLPGNSSRASDNLELYLAQRPLAKICRSLIPLLLRTPAARMFEQVTIAVDADSNWMRFMVRQAGLQEGLPEGSLPTPAIKFGGIAGKSSRLVILLHDASGHPIRVIKVGLNPAGRAATDREADLLCRLPEGVIGCTGITGRFNSANVSAFATTYFPGASLDNDLGIEKLFRCWLNDAPLEPLENLASWRELESVVPAATTPEWPLLRAALAGQMVRTTLFHGDFTPWNVRMANLENIRAFDWERGHLKGIPGWDWFHFIVQTSILVKRHSGERIAAELEQLFHSPRFQKYAAEAGITQIVEPLLLAYLLHQKRVVQPEEGREPTRRLFQLLWQQWQVRQTGGRTTLLPAAVEGRPLAEQFSSMRIKLANLLWEPSLSPEVHPPILAQCRRHWPALLVALVWIGGVAWLHNISNAHLMLAPLYLVPCVWLVQVAGRRPALLMAVVAAVAASGWQSFTNPRPVAWEATIWNIAMRIMVFQLVVVLLHNARKNNHWYQPSRRRSEPGAWLAIKANWAVVLFTVCYLALLVLLNVRASPHGSLAPFYLLPGVVFTLAINVRWGTLAAVLSAGAGALAQHLGDPIYYTWPDTVWNACMRLAMFQVIVLMVDRVNRKNILFSDPTAE